MAACTPLFRSLVLKHFLSNFQVWPPDQGPSSLKTTCSGTSPFAHFYQQLSLSLLRLFTLAFQGGLKSGALVYMLDYANHTFSAFHKTFSFIGRNNPHTNKITSSLGGRKNHKKKKSHHSWNKTKQNKKEQKSHTFNQRPLISLLLIHKDKLSAALFFFPAMNLLSEMCILIFSARCYTQTISYDSIWFIFVEGRVQL